MVSPVGERLPLGEYNGLPRWGRTPPVGKGSLPVGSEMVPTVERDSIPRWKVNMMISPGTTSPVGSTMISSGGVRLPQWGVWWSSDRDDFVDRCF